MSSPYDPRQMPPAPDDPDGFGPPQWRRVNPRSGPPASSYAYRPGSTNPPSYPTPPGYGDYSNYGRDPGYGSEQGFPPEVAPPQTSPHGPPQYIPGRLPPPPPQWTPSSASLPSGGDPRRTWEGWGPSGQPPFAPQGLAEAEPDEQRRPSPLVIGAALFMALVLVVVAGAGIAYTQYKAPGDAATAFCNHVTSQDYGATYEDLATGLQAQYQPDAFVSSARLADKLLGPVTSCTATTSGSDYRFGLGGSSAHLPISLMRAQAGAFSEVVTLVPDQGRWRLLHLDAGLFGLDLQPLLVASTFCVDLQAHDYSALYGLLDAHARGAVTKADFNQEGALHEQIDGAPKTCSILSIVKSATPSSTASLSVILAVTREQTTTQQGLVTVMFQSGSWQIDSYAGNLLGSDLTPLTVGGQFCAALVANNYPAAYALVSDHDKSLESEQQFAYNMGAGLIKWTGCTPDYSTYKVIGGTASYTTNMQATAPTYGANFAPGVELTFVKQGNRWLVDSAQIVY